MDSEPDDTVDALAMFLHQNYEEIAVDVGWETQDGTSVPFEDLPEKNREVMTRLARRVRSNYHAMPAPTDRQLQPLMGVTFRVLDSVEKRLEADELKDFKRRLSRAMGYFPHLSGEVVTVGCRWDPDKDHSRFNPYAQADPVNRMIRIPTHERCSNVTIFHELAHLAIEIAGEEGEDVPTSSEEFCSLYAVARQPAELIDEWRIPYFGMPTVPREDWPGICQDAIEYRENHHAYIQKARQWLAIREGSDGE